ncbi:MAG: glycosyltransferase, partial [Proteobacteria bacterium]|nr:glycosyltransferase [Pseudomonadota bacterium]
YIMLWRGWRAKKPDASLSDCRRILRSLRRSEFEWMSDADGVLYAARGHERLLDRIPFTNKPRRWLPTACPPPDSASPAAADDSPRAYDLGYAGSLAPDNGLDTLLAALQNLDGATLCLIGGGKGKYVRRLQQTVQALGLDHRVTFTGKVPFAAVRPRMRQCRLGIAPISARCGPEKRKYASPLKLVEWMAAGVPVVASTVPSVTQHVSDGREAALVRPDSPSELAAAIKKLLTNAEARAKLAKAGRAFAEQSSYSIRAQRILNFVEELIRRRP